MENKNFWKIFENTGDVNDYINYKSENTSNCANESPKDDLNEPQSDNNNNGPCTESDKDGRK